MFLQSKHVCSYFNVLKRLKTLQNQPTNFWHLRQLLSCYIVRHDSADINESNIIKFKNCKFIKHSLQKKSLFELFIL